MPQPKKASLQKEKPITPFDFYAGMAMAAYIIGCNGSVDKEYIKKEATAWAEYMMS